MKKLLLILMFVPLVSFSQEKNILLTLGDILKIYPNQFPGAYFDDRGNMLFDGDYDADSDDKFKIETYLSTYFKGDYITSESCTFEWYSDSDGKLISIKSIYFSKEEDKNYPRIGSEILYSSNGKIKNIIHH